MATVPKHILIVEDDEMVQAFLALHLEIEGYTVTLAGNGREMLRAISGGHPDLILLDLNLPDGDGLSLAQHVRESSSVPIIIATARKDQEDRLLGLGIGVDEYMTKPFDPKELILRVRNLLERANPSSRATYKPIRLSGPPVEWPVEENETPSTLPARRWLYVVLTLTAVIAAAIAGIWLLFPESKTRQSQGSRPAQISPVASRPASPALPVKTTPKAPEAQALPVEEEPTLKTKAELLGYGWVTSTQCHPLPRVVWWKYKSHESIAGYVQRKHGGDWTPYQEKWLIRLVKLQDIFERNSSALTRTGVVLKGDALETYIKQMQKRLVVINCLAKESRLAQRKTKRQGRRDGAKALTG